MKFLNDKFCSWINDRNLRAKINQIMIKKIIIFLISIIVSFLTFKSYQNSFTAPNSTSSFILLILLISCSFSYLIFYKINQNRFVNLKYILFILPIINLISFPILNYTTIALDYPNYPSNMNYTTNIINKTNIDIALDKQINFSTDNFGFRKNTEIEIDYYKKKGFRIILIGGSTSLNDHVNDSETWANLLNKKLLKKYKSIEIINTSVNGLFLKDHVNTMYAMSNYNPDLFIFKIPFNDITLHIGNAKKSNSPYSYYMPFERGIFYLLLKNIRNLVFKKYHAGYQNNNEIKNLTFPKKNKLEKNGQAINSVSKNFKFYLNKIVQYCNKKKINCIFINDPNIYDSNSNKKYLEFFWRNRLEPHQMLNALTIYNNYLKKKEGNNIIYFDLDSKFNKEFKYFYDEIHFTKLGTRKVANEIYNFILNSKIINLKF